MFCVLLFEIIYKLNKMKVFFLLALTFTIFFFASCNPNGSSKEEEYQPLTFLPDSLKQVSGVCDTSTMGGCATISFLYFKAQGGHVGVADAINSQIYAMLAGGIPIDEPLDTAAFAHVDSARQELLHSCKAFLKLYEEDKEATEGFFAAYSASSDTDFVVQTPKVISMGHILSSYQGGAHPNSYMAIQNFRVADGTLLPPAAFIADKEALTILAEKKFRERQSIAPNADLSAEGYFLNEAKQFFLPANIGVLKEGLLFHYNPYEIAPYAVGPIQFVVTYSELGNSVTPNVVH